MLAWIGFFVGLAIIIFSGTKLARYGDIIAERTGLGGVTVGMLLIAAVTSMPEVATGISSAALIGSADLAAGTMFGSNVFNLVILAVLDGMSNNPILASGRKSYRWMSWAIVALTAIGILAMLTQATFGSWHILFIGIPTLVIFVLYLISFIRISKIEKEESAAEGGEQSNQYADVSMSKTWVGFAIAALAIIGAGIMLSFSADAIAEQTGWGRSFVGSLLLAVSTSAPEVVVCIPAMRIGAKALAISNILGSNMFNMGILFVVDLFYSGGSVLGDVSSSNLITAAAGILMAMVVFFGLIKPGKSKVFKVFAWYSPLLIIMYIAAFFFLFQAGG